MTKKRVFVTVGTTKFEELIKAVLTHDVLNILQKLGYVEVQLQTGNANFEKVIHPGTTINYDSYFENFGEHVDRADLVISHAGAGTCLEVLRQGKPLIAVVNDGLMSNHQVELAEQLQHDGHIYYCTCATIKEALKKDLQLLRKYPAPNKTTFASYLDKCMGFQ